MPWRGDDCRAKFTDARKYGGSMKRELRDMLNHLNWNWGRGEIIAIDEQTQTVTRRMQYGEDKRKYRVDGNTVYFCGHKLTMRGH
jgi:hypothetical protein